MGGDRLDATNGAVRMERDLWPQLLSSPMIALRALPYGLLGTTEGQALTVRRTGQVARPCGARKRGGRAPAWGSEGQYDCKTTKLAKCGLSWARWQEQRVHSGGSS